MQQATKLNPMQQYMIRVFDRKFNEKQEAEIKNMLSEYFAKLVDEEMDEIWVQKKMSQNDLNKALNTHYRTPYSHKN
jgi:ribonucleotide reductase beta subunit family protein with ferritin-like domain